MSFVECLSFFAAAGNCRAAAEWLGEGGGDSDV
jgi:hypothetical protein